MSEYRFLPHINEPADIKALTDEDLQVLAEEMRCSISVAIACCSMWGTSAIPISC
jgi:deoxyxylulose-5-phosphate synthase